MLPRGPTKGMGSHRSDCVRTSTRQFSRGRGASFSAECSDWVTSPAWAYVREDLAGANVEPGLAIQSLPQRPLRPSVAKAHPLLVGPDASQFHTSSRRTSRGTREGRPLRGRSHNPSRSPNNEKRSLHCRTVTRVVDSIEPRPPRPSPRSKRMIRARSPIRYSPRCPLTNALSAFHCSRMSCSRSCGFAIPQRSISSAIYSRCMVRNFRGRVLVDSRRRRTSAVAPP
jgi:hypothetical protein